MHDIEKQYIKDKIHNLLVGILSLFVFLSGNGETMAQTVIMENGQTKSINLCSNGVDIYDDGGPSGNYSNAFDGEVILYTVPGANIILTGSYNVENSYDHITIFDGNTQIAYYTSSGTANAVATSGSMRIIFHSDFSVVRSGFSFHASTPYIPVQCHLSVSNLTINNLNATSGTLTWEGTGTNLLLDLGNGPIPVSGNSHRLTNLNGNTDYTALLYEQEDSSELCCKLTLHFRTPIPGGHGCIDPTDLSAPYVQGYYGSFGNPYSSLGIVNDGPGSSFSRHTVHTNTAERDPRTGNNLPTVPPGGTSSVRLGNWRTGSEAEAILYAIEVDTLVSDLLILNYAAVLEDPNHSSSEQPRFRLEILNSNMEVIDPTCGMADFIANANLGWNNYGGTLWKNWTTVGIDLNPYSGQTIMVRFTTYDCAQSGHYGYAYFNLECSRKNMTSESCGNNTSNTFTVPAGFNYLWYTDSPSNPISTSRSISVTTNNNTIYHCLLSFVDKPQCNFNMSAFAGVRFPLSLFDTTISIDNCQFDVNFINRSTISADGITPSGSGESCETAWWDFGNGDTSALYNASTHYNAPGTYTVTLISTIANGACADTLQIPITVMPPGPNPIITGPTDLCEGKNSSDTLLIHNTVWNSNGSDTLIVNPTATTTYTVSATDSSNCPYTLEHTITIHPSYHLHDSASICPPDLPFTYGSLIITDASDTGSYSYEETSIFGCDSIGTMFLTVKDTNSADTIAVACDSFSWYGETYTSSGDVASRITTNIAGCDSTTTLKLTVLHSSTSTIHDTVVENQLPHHFNGNTFTAPTNDSAVVIANAVGCDSTISYSLHIHWNVDTTLFDTLCNSALPLTWNSVIFDTTLAATATTTRSIILPTHVGSDSLITMHLTVHPTFDHHLTTEICDNQQYLFGDSTFLGADGSTEHLDSLLSIHGCDSLSSLHLTVHPTFDHHTFDTLCSNQSTLFSGVSYNTSGVYPHPFLSFHHCDSLSTLHLQVWPAYDFHTFDTLCDDSSRFFIDSAYRHTGTYLYSYLSQHACDSLQTLHLKVFPTYDLHFFDTIYDGDRYTFEHTLFDTTGVYPFLLHAAFGCDSLRTLHLQRNRRTYNDSLLCQNHLPLLWNGITFSDRPHSGNTLTLRDSVHLSGLNGIDSLVVMRVVARDTSASVDRLHGCDSLRWQDGQNYSASTTQPFVTLANAASCDSVVHLALTIDYTHLFTDRRQACDSMQWIDGQLYYRDTVGPLDTLVTVGGCDSIVTLDLAVFYATYEEAVDTFCHGEMYYWRSFNVSSTDTFATVEFYLTDTVKSVHGCDSVLAIRLTKMARPIIAFSYETDCGLRTYDLKASTDANYILWNSVPYDSLLNNNEYFPLITVGPQEPTEYILYADYHETPLCPVTESILLLPVDIPTAEIKAVPQVLTHNSMEYNIYDISHEYKERVWYLDGVRQSETSRHLWGYADDESDSLIFALDVYNGQCHDTAVCVVPVLKAAVFAPNVFTPNLDQNNRFTLKHHGILDGELFIYNREGLLVYRTTDFADKGWDGGNCPQGNYVWRFEYHALDYPNALKSEIGTVLLLR